MKNQMKNQIKKASEILVIPEQQIRLMLQSKEFEWLGIAFKRPNSKRYSYYVNFDGIQNHLNRFKD